ncbi:phage late control D family protein [Treponema succinifaciens]|uniref:phage late control D family protein n=1 Tax=Treponema succinifaciens TaxID=167 RepID=UPI001FDF5564|nr:contractile injection system protein, VgrG/Pvc8 family [Treponema succinifaciens]
MDGARLGWKHEGALKSIRIHDGLNSIGTASLVFDLPATDFDNDDVFSEGSEVSVHLGYKDDVEEVFSGEVTGFVPRFGEYGAPQMEVQIETKLHRLDKGIRAKAFESKTTAQIIKEIITNHNLKAEVEEFGPKHDYTEQRNITDYDYITLLAYRYGKAVWCQGSTVHVKTEITPSDDDVILERGKSIISARTRTSIAKQLSAAACTGWSIMDCRGFAATATMKDIPLRIGGEYSWEDNSKGYDPKRTEQITTEEILDEEDAAAVAKAYIQNRSFKFQSCDIKTQGNYRIKPGNRLTVKYVGKQSDGEYLIESVEHTLDMQGGFITRCHLIRNFCEVCNRSGTASKIDRERADNQINGTQGENATAASAGGSQVENQDDSENAPAEKNPTITNPHWEDADGQTITKALVGDEVYLCADVTDIDDGATATIRIVEKDDDGNDDDLTVLTDKVQDGKIRCDWKVVYMEDNDDTESQKEIEEKGYTLPEYAFTVECDGVESDESPQLDVRGWIKFQLKETESDRIFSNVPVRILKEDGTIIKCKSDENGYVYLKDLLFGKYSIELDAN